MPVINLIRFLQFLFPKPNLIQLIAQEDINVLIFHGSFKILILLLSFYYC